MFIFETTQLASASKTEEQRPTKTGCLSLVSDNILSVLVLHYAYRSLMVLVAMALKYKTDKKLVKDQVDASDTV